MSVTYEPKHGMAYLVKLLAAYSSASSLTHPTAMGMFSPEMAETIINTEWGSILLAVRYVSNVANLSW